MLLLVEQFGIGLKNENFNHDQEIIILQVGG